MKRNFCIAVWLMLCFFAKAETTLSLSDTAKVLDYSEKAKAIMRQATPDTATALEYLRLGMNMARQIGYQRGEAELLRAIGNLYFSQKNFEQALQLYQQSLDLCIAMRDNAGTGRNYMNMAMSYREQAQLYSALNSLLNALSIYKQSNDIDGMLEAYSEIIGIYNDVGNNAAAISYAEEALAIAHNAGNKYEEARLYDILARNTLGIGLTVNVEDYFKQSIQLFEELNMPLQVARITQNLAAQQLKDYDIRTRMQLFKKAAAIYESHEPTNTALYTIYNNMSLLYGSLSDTCTRKQDAKALADSATAFKRKALNKAISSGNSYLIAQAYYSSGSFYLNRQNLKQADAYYLRAYEQAVKSGNRRTEVNALDGLSKVKTMMGNYRQAMDYLEKYRVMQTQLATADYEQSESQLSRQYEFARDERAKNEDIKIQIARQNQSLKYQKNMRVGLSGAVVVIICLLMLIFRWNAMSKRLNLQLSQQQVEIASGTDKLQQMNNELSAYKDLLEKRVNEQTERLRQSEKQLSALSDNLPGGCIFRKIVYPDGRMQMPYLSNTASVWLGISVDEVRDDITQFYKLLNTKDLKEKQKLEAEAAKTMTAYTCEIRMDLPQGINWVLFTSTPHLNPANDAIIWDGIVVDITAQKAVEEELIRARQHSERSDMLKSTFLANMSHEIRTPMNGIVGFLSLLEQDKLSAERRQFYIRVIRSNVQQLLQLIGDIVDISKIDTQQLQIHPIAFDLNGLMDELEVLFQDVVSHENKKLEVMLDNSGFVEPCFIYSDPVRVRQVLINLLANAVKYSPKGFIRFGYALEDNDTTLHFFVEDTGIGIPQEKLSMIFDRYMQVNDQAMNAVSGNRGAGLGLAISKNLIEMLHGIIWVESETNVGSVFHFTLPYLPRNKK